jgi:glucokinase
MYLGVDVGGTKTLVAALTDEGEISQQVKFPTPEDYDHWLLELRHTLAHFRHHDFHAAGLGIAGRINRKHGRHYSAGHLGWDNVPIQADVERIVGCPVALENDAKLAGLSEAMLRDERRVLYVTISTGVGFGLVIDGQIDQNIGDSGGNTIMVDYRGRHVSWESVASGRAIVERYGKKAMDIHDGATWRTIARIIASGLGELIAIAEPEVVVFGGSVGVYFDRFGHFLEAELKRYELPLLMPPALVKAQRPEEAVIYGCYDFAKQRFGHAVAAD